MMAKVCGRVAIGTDCIGSMMKDSTLSLLLLRLEDSVTWMAVCGCLSSCFFAKALDKQIGDIEVAYSHAIGLCLV